jgi:hypothetical protein
MIYSPLCFTTCPHLSPLVPTCPHLSPTLSPLGFPARKPLNHSVQFAVQFLFQYLSTTDVCWPAAVNALAAIAGSRGISALLEVSLCSRVLTVFV